jgi:hypothetical protein
VHVSRYPTPLGPPDLAAIAKAAIYYDDVIDSLLPEERRGTASYWARSNLYSAGFAGFSLDDCYAAIDDTAEAIDVDPLVGLVNLIPMASPYGISHNWQEDGVRGKVYKWNFEGMLNPARQTVECRLPPGCVSADDVERWVGFVLAFVAGATALGCAAVVPPLAMAQMDDLESLVRLGGKMMGLKKGGPGRELFRY